MYSTNMKSILFSTCLFSVIIILGCVKSRNNCPKLFEIPSSVSPYSEEYNIGDTITITSKFSKYVYEKLLSEYFDMSGINWHLSTGIHNMDTLEGELTYVTGKHFDFIYNSTYDYDLSYLSDGSSYLSGEPNMVNDSFQLEVELVAKVPGLFYITHASIIQVLGIDEDFEGKCAKNDDHLVYTVMNEGRDNNIHLLSESNNPHFNTWIPQKPEERFDREGGYCFRVVE